MKREKIDIGKGLYNNTQDIATRNGFSPMFINGYATEANTVKMRSGLKTFSNITTASKINGLYWSSVLQKLIIVASGVAYYADEEGGVTEITGDVLDADQRVSFVTDTSRVFMANGGTVRHTDGVTISKVTGYETPVDFLDYIDEYILGLKTGSQDIFYSDPIDRTIWDALGYFAVASSEDTNQNFKVVWNEITVAGTKYTDVSYNDQNTPFTQLAGAGSSVGCIAPWTLIHTANGLYWLDNKKKLITLIDRQPKILSIPIQKELDGLVTVSDAYSFSIDISGRQFIVMSFHEEDVTYVYDPLMRVWYQWGHWDAETNSYKSLLINCYTYVPEWNRHFVGDKASGNVYEIDGQVDLENQIRFLIRTDHISHGIMRKKRSEALYIKVKRGLGTLDEEDKLLMRTNDNGKNIWSDWKELSLGKSFDREHLIIKKCNGIYATRQYEFVYTGSGDFEIAGQIEEEVTVL